MKKLTILLPLILLITICLFFLLFILFEKDPNNPPSALLNKNLPIFSSVNLYNDNEFLVSEDLKGKYTLINFFASWCAPCKAEHNLFFEIKKEIPELFIFGVSYKDNPTDSKNYLKEEGNPYSFVGVDQEGKIAFEFGVFGLPETYIVNNKGKIIFKHAGALTRKIIDDEITKLF